MKSNSRFLTKAFFLIKWFSVALFSTALALIFVVGFKEIFNL